MRGPISGLRFLFFGVLLLFLLLTQSFLDQLLKKFNHKSKAGDRKMQKELKLKMKAEERKRKRAEKARLDQEEEMRKLEELTRPDKSSAEKSN